MSWKGRPAPPPRSIDTGHHARLDGRTGRVVFAAVLTLATGAGCSSGPGAAPSSTSIVPTVRPPAAPAVPTPTAGPSVATRSTAPWVTAPPGAITIEMSGPPPRFRPDVFRAPAGEVTFFLINRSPGNDPHGHHTVAIGKDMTKPIAASEDLPGATRAVFTVKDLTPGEYVIWCMFPDHADLGQTATLTIE